MEACRRRADRKETDLQCAEQAREVDEFVMNREKRRLKILWTSQNFW